MQRKIHESPAERQRAYRQRLKERHAGQPPPAPRTTVKKVARPQRLAAVLDELDALADGYRNWLAAMPANQGESDLAERLQETIDQFEEAIELVSQIEPPRGFGR